MINIGLDMLGGDFAPEQVVQGLRYFYDQTHTHEATIIAFGDELVLKQAFKDNGLDNKPIKIVHAPAIIGMHEHPTKAFKEKQDSSLVVGFGAMKQGHVDAFVSAGNTGCMLVGSMLFLKTLPGVKRPAVPTIIPKIDGSTGILLDVGLNADCKPENLNQFAYLGSKYAQNMFSIAKPKVALLNIGEEEGKGNLLAQAAYPMLKENKQINFIGNVEGRDVLTGQADVIVCDGFVGNIVLKMAESFYGISRKLQIQDPYFKRFNFEQYGGVPVLGVEKPVIIGHGVSGAEAFKNMLNVTLEMCNKGLKDYEINE